MGHILRSAREELAAVRWFSGPNIVCFSRRSFAPIPLLEESGDDDEKADDPDSSEVIGTKQELKGKSARSCLRQAKVLSSLDWQKFGECLHVSLSYWHKYPRVKEELAHAKQSLVQAVGEMVECGQWGLEYQTERFEKSGLWVPHWHLLVWLNGRDPVEFEERIRNYWANPRRKHRNSNERGVSVTSGDQARGAWYLAMHAAKRAQSPPFNVGRWWGYIRRDRLKEACDMQQIGAVPDRLFVWWARLFRRSTGCKTRQRGQCPQGFSWFLPRDQQMVAYSWIQSRIEVERLELSSRFRKPF